VSLRTLDPDRAATLEKLCELFVPGSSRVGPVVYIDAVVSGMPPELQAAVTGSIDALAPAADGGPDALAEHERTPEFAFIRALAVEAFYSDFVAPGASGPSAYEEIDFHSPLAMRIKKDWSYIGVAG
jgi:hypothetical protein